MLDINTFLTYLYVIVDDLCKQQFTHDRHRGRCASLVRSEVVTLALFSQWCHFSSERDFYRYAERHLQRAFPGLPDRAQFNRLMRQHTDAVVACFLELSQRLTEPSCAYEALDGTAAVTRDAKRRGLGWLPGMADIGWSNRVGWYEGFEVLLSVTPEGAITGFGFGAASTSEFNLAETFFALRDTPDPRLPTVGASACGVYVTDKGFDGRARRDQWREHYGAVVICTPRRNSRHPWPRPWRRWLASIRQIVETVNGCVHRVFRLDRERPHSLAGFQVRLAAKMALHNFCLWLNQQLGRAPLAFADLIAW